MNGIRRGITLVEVLVALVIFSFVIAGAAQFFIAQSGMFRRGSRDMALAQNVRFGTDLLHSHIRIAGSRVVAGQPLVVYASGDLFAFNADYASNVADDAYSVYIDPELPAGKVMALPLARQVTLPGTVYTYPSETYLAADGLASPAETIVFFFAPDTTTDRPDDWVLFRQVNDFAPEALVRNILRTEGTEFFRYHYFHKSPDGVQSLELLPLNKLPLSFVDDGTPTLLDSLRAVEIAFTVTNGDVGETERTREVALVVPLPHLGKRKLEVCGGAPLPSGIPTAVAVPDGPLWHVVLTWAPSGDEASGEQDIVRYVLWRRIDGDPEWGDPFLSIPAGSDNYTFTDTSVEPATTYQYAVAAQDCTPKLSQGVFSNSVTLPNF